MKLDTSKDRLHVVKEPDARAAKIGESFSNIDRYVIGDIMDIEDEPEETREKFIAICAILWTRGARFMRKFTASEARCHSAAVAL